jgi:hypothetical protein
LICGEKEKPTHQELWRMGFGSRIWLEDYTMILRAPERVVPQQVQVMTRQLWQQGLMQ